MLTDIDDYEEYQIDQIADYLIHNKEGKNYEKIMEEICKDIKIKSPHIILEKYDMEKKFDHMRLLCISLHNIEPEQTKNLFCNHIAYTKMIFEYNFLDYEDAGDLEYYLLN